MTEISGPYCSCLKVSYSPEECGGGKLRERWTCDLCGSEYIKRAIHDYQIERLTAENSDLDDALNEIKNWCRAYPRTVFIEPTKNQWKRANEVLEATEDCPSLTAISGSNMRHVVEGIQKIIDTVSGRQGQNDG